MGLMKRAGYGGMIIFVLGVIVAIPGERRRSHILKHGRRLRGPELATASEFNRRYRETCGFWYNGACSNSECVEGWVSG